jgi:Ca2+/H+ antiporter, TMEM165/GDT1 family
MEAFLTSLGVVAIAEIGDRTQLLAIVLASRFRQPIPIICGIFVATLANHALAASAGEWFGDLLAPSVLRWFLTLSFAGMAVWVLVPDRPAVETVGAWPKHGALVTTVIGFFIAEIGDKTQIATAGLAARFDQLLPVVIGTTAGMMVANVPVVLFGHHTGHRISAAWTRYVAAAIFAAEAALSFAGLSVL